MRYVLFLLFNIAAISTYAQGPRMGTYEVPVPDPLQPYSVYHMEITDDVYSKGPNIFTFPLPESLIGKKRVFKMVRVGDTDNWQGDDVSGTCQTLKKYFRCEVKFRNLEVDKNQVSEKIQKEFPKEDLEKRLEVAMRFAGEPIGIVTYEMTDEEQKWDLSNFW